MQNTINQIMRIVSLVLLYIFLIKCHSVNKSNKNSKKTEVKEHPTQLVSFDNFKKVELEIDNQDSSINNQLESGRVIVGENGLPRYIGDIDISLKNTNKVSSKLALDYLDKIKNRLKIKNVYKEFYLHSINKDQTGQEHIKLNQRYNGIDIFGSRVIVHLKDKKFVTFNGRYFSTPNISVKPKISSDKAIEISKNYISKLGGLKFIEDNQRVGEYSIAPFSSKLVVYNINNKNNLSWELDITMEDMKRYKCFVSAEDGRVLDFYNNSPSCFSNPYHNEAVDRVNKKTAIMAASTVTKPDLKGVSRTINTFRSRVGSGATVYHFPFDATKAMHKKLPNNASLGGGNGNIVILEVKGGSYKSVKDENGNFSDTLVSAMYNTEIVYDYYYKTHGRKNIFGEDITNLYNNKGVRNLNVVLSDKEGSAYFTIVTLTNSDGTFKYNLPAAYLTNDKINKYHYANSLDIIAHEITHGVIAYEGGLVYKGQSGALNEALADIFGIMVDRDDWLIGDELYHASSGKNIRNIKNPTKIPKHMSEYRRMDYDAKGGDNGGVHFNSGIISHAFYKLATYDGMSKSIAEKIFYDAMVNRVTPYADFVDMRLAAQESAKTLYDMKTYFKVGEAFDEVGIYVNRGKFDNKIGDQYVLYYNTDAGKTGTFYYDKFENGNLKKEAKKLSDTKSKHMPSIDDGGKYAYFVNEAEGKIKKIDLSTETEGYVTIPAGGDINPLSGLDYASISKDGDKIAYSKGDVICFYSFNKNSRACFNFKDNNNQKRFNKVNKIEWNNKSRNVLVEFATVKSKFPTTKLNLLVAYFKIWDKGGFVSSLSPQYYNFRNTKTKIYIDLGSPTYFDNDDKRIYLKFKYTNETIFKRVMFRYINYKDDSRLKETVFFADYRKQELRSTNGGVKDANYDLMQQDNHYINSFKHGGKDSIRIFDVLGKLGLVYPPQYSYNRGDKRYIENAKWGISFTKQTTPRKLLSSDKDITYFGFFDGDKEYSGTIEADRTITVDVEKGIDRTKLKAYFENSKYSEVKLGVVLQETGKTINDFSSQKTFTVKAEDDSEQDYLVKVRYMLSDKKKITEFKIEKSLNSGLLKDYIAQINDINKSIVIDDFENYDKTSLVTSFSYIGDNVKVNNVIQTSGTTSNDFTNKVYYRVFAENGRYVDYTVKINKKGISLSDEKEITEFKIEKSLNTALGLTKDFIATINKGDKTIKIKDFDDVNSLNELIASFTYKGDYVKVGNVLQKSGQTKNDFTNSVIYKVFAEDGTNLNYSVKINKKGVTPSSKKQINIFKIEKSLNTDLTKNYAADIDEYNKKITISDFENISLKGLIATFEYEGNNVKVGNEIQQSGNTANDFTSPVTYVVAAEDNSKVRYEVIINKKGNLSDKKKITEFKIEKSLNAGLDKDYIAQIDESKKIISINNFKGDKLDNLVASFTHSGELVKIGNIIQKSGQTKNDFTNSVVYRVFAEDNSHLDYTVNITKESDSGNNGKNKKAGNNFYSVTNPIKDDMKIFVKDANIKSVTVMIFNLSSNILFNKSYTNIVDGKVIIHKVDYNLNKGLYIAYVYNTDNKSQNYSLNIIVD